MPYAAPTGAKDILPEEWPFWRHIEQNIQRITALYGLEPLGVPIFESTALFTRGVGEGSDLVVQKEMYSFQDKSGDELTLRPEFTAGIMRAYVENGMHTRPAPLRLGCPGYRPQACGKRVGAVAGGVLPVAARRLHGRRDCRTTGQGGTGWVRGPDGDRPPRGYLGRDPPRVNQSLLQMNSAARMPGTQPAIVSSPTSRTDPQPLSNTASGGSKMQSSARPRPMRENSCRLARRSSVPALIVCRMPPLRFQSACGAPTRSCRVPPAVSAARRAEIADCAERPLANFLKMR